MKFSNVAAATAWAVLMTACNSGDNDQAAAGTKPFITRGLNVLAARASRFLDRLFNHMSRHVVALGSFDEAAQSRIGFRVRYAVLGRHVQLFCVLGIEL